MKESLKSFIRPLYYWQKTRLMHIKEYLFAKKVVDFKSIPIIINNYNRLFFLKMLIESLEQRGYFNIYIIDNASTYPPLLEYYKDCKYEIFRLKKNIGYLSLWETKIYQQFINSYYVYTDSDVIPIDDCPDDFLEQFWKIMQKYKFATKVGFSLKIDDLPDNFNKKRDVLNWENVFWTKQKERGLFLAPIDTTFALYRPWVKWGANWYVEQFRTGYPLMAKHMPWYNNSEKLSEEEAYYIDNAKTSTHWSK